MTRDRPETREPFSVLVVEDDQDHAALIQAAFTYRAFPCRVHITGSSEEAMDYLLGRWPFDDRERNELPDVIILDIGLPGRDGLSFLRWLQDQEEPWADTPVVIFTALPSRVVAAEATALGAREIKSKPAGFNELAETIDQILLRWRPNIA